MPVDLPSREDLFQIGAQEVFARGATRPENLRLSPTAAFTEGTDLNIVLAACSAMGDEALRHLAIRMAALYLDSAEDEDLDRLVADHISKDLPRKQAAQASALLTFQRSIPPSTGAAGALAVGTKVRTPFGTEYALTEAVGFPLNASGPFTGAALATLAGTGGNAVANQITQFAQTPFDSTLQVTNLTPAAGGADVESNESYRARARDFFRTARRAILAAIEFGALTVDGVVTATAIELLGSDGLPNGYVQCFIADSTGQSNQLLADAVSSALLEFRAGGIPVQVITTTPRFEAINYQLSFRTGTDTRAAVQQLKAITVSAVNLIQANEPLQRSLLMALARSIPGAIVPDNAVTLPAGDVVPASGEIIKTSLDRVTVNGL